MRPFRFGFTGGVSSKRAKLLDSASAVEGLFGSLCRCTGYQGIVAAVRPAARAG